MRLRYAWIDVPFFILTILLLIPLLFHLAGIVIDFLSSNES